ncbi:MAG: hypothetical protein WAT20_00020 [Ferruginibacter sp.]
MKTKYEVNFKNARAKAGTGCWMLDAGYWMLDTGYWILGTLSKQEVYPVSRI